MEKMMKAVVLDQPAAYDQIRLAEIPVPAVKKGTVLVKVMAFGMNHSEEILRLSEIRQDYIRKPIVPGIECVGIVADPGNTNLKKGQKVVALMGGMGRSFNGSYAEYALLPASHVFAIDSSLSWKELAAVPETYFTAWGSLFMGLQLKENDTLLIRGATCALGYAAIQLAKAIGCKVIATTHKEEKLSLLKEADEAVLDDGHLERKGLRADKALDLVGPRFLLDTLRSVKKDGIVCDTGILGGLFALNNFDPIKGIPNGVYLTSFYSNDPDQKTIATIFRFIEEHRLNPPVGVVFRFSDILQACKAQETGTVNGKIVVVMDDFCDDVPRKK